MLISKSVTHLGAIAITLLAGGLAVHADQSLVATNPPSPVIPEYEAWDALGYHPERLLVRFDDAATPEMRKAALDAAGVTSVEAELWLVPGLLIVRAPADHLQAALQSLAKAPGVQYAELSLVYRTQAQTMAYGIPLVNAPLAWPQTRGSGVRVAVLDTGVDIGHPDLPLPIVSETFIAGQGVQDGNQHGTHCSGIVLARDNDIGVVGVAPLATLVTGKVLSDGGSGDSAGIILGIQWAVSNQARVISMSLGGGGFEQSFADACAAAVASNVVVVAASGNGNTSVPSYPAAYPGVISVAAVDSSSVRASFSNFGPTVSISAPGVGVLSTVPAITSSTVAASATWNNVARASSPLTGTGIATVTGPAIYCGTGGLASDFPATVAGKIAHIRRGGLDSNGARWTFITKTQNAIAAGAIGVIISNDSAGSFTGTLNTNVSIPVVSVTQADGDDLQTNNGTTATVAVTLAPGPQYASLSGTSMACPHVAGVAALLISSYPWATAAQVRQAMEQTAQDLGDPGRDDLYGWGLVKADLARTMLGSIVGPPPCVADIVGVGGNPPPDGQLTGDDFIAFINAFAVGGTLADIVSVGGNPPPDGQVTGDDFIAFINSFAAGCP